MVCIDIKPILGKVLTTMDMSFQDKILLGQVGYRRGTWLYSCCYGVFGFIDACGCVD